MLYRVAEENLIQLSERRAFFWLLFSVSTHSLLLFSSLSVKKKGHLFVRGWYKLNWRLEAKKSTRKT